MRKKKAQRVLTGTSGLLALSIALPVAHAQQTTQQAETLDEVVVTGIRSSLQKSMEMKRNAPGVVDVITAEDIGKFPDSNVAASLQRVPGVSIQRSGQRGEPTGITVRGFSGDFNETLIDGRRLSTAGGGRSIDFSTVGADFVGSLTVMKTPDVTLSSSSIGATLNVAYPKPLDRPGMHFSASGAASEQDDASKIEPTIGVLFSDTFAENSMGVLVDAIYTRHETNANRVFSSGWEGGLFRPCQMTTTCTAQENAVPGTIVGWWIQQFGAEQSQTNDERIDGRIAFQWKPSDNQLITFDDNYSKQTIETGTYGFGLWFNRDDLRSVVQDANGTVTDFRQAGTPMDLNGGFNDQELETNQIGLNYKISVSDNLSFDTDLSYSKSKQNPSGGGNDGADIGYGGTLGFNMGVQVKGDSANTLPQMTTYGPNGDTSRYLDPSIIGSHVLVRTLQENTDTIKQLRFTTTWKQDNVSVNVGGSYMDDEFTLQGSNTFANNFWQTWSGYGAPSGRTSGVVVPSSIYQGTIKTSNFIHGFSGSAALPPSLLVYSPYDLYNFLEGLGNPQATNIPGYNYGCCGTAYTGSLDRAVDPGSIQDITEKTWAIFLSTHFDAELGSKPFHVTAGMRREHTSVDSGGFGRLPISLTQSPADPTLLSTQFTDPPAPISTGSDYSYLLPSVDVKLELTDAWHLRFDASRTLTRPAITFLSPVLNVGSLPRVGALNANGGNPDLKPYLSDNVDLALEWYYGDNSYASINGFVKNVTNFIVQGTRQQTINDVIDPTTGQRAIYTVSQRVNGPDAQIDGIEVAWQHVFGESGFGFNANATFVDTNKPFDRTDISTSGFAVTGLANSANLVAFYDKHGFELRIAGNWRDEYLLQFGQNQNNSRFGAEPTFVNASLQVDLSTSYQVTENVNVYFEALNLTDETYSTHGRWDNELLDAFQYGRRYALGVRFRL